MNLLFFYTLASIVSAVAQPQVSTLSARTMTKECHEWVDSVYNSLDERQRVAQLVVANVNPSGESCKDAIKAYVEGQQVGGLLFSKGSLAQHAEMIDYAQSISKVPLLMTFDGEWGLSMRIPESPKFPYNMTLGAISRPGLLYDYGQEMGRECRALGIQVDFAPVLDVNTNSKNPVIGDRSFGEDPYWVGKLGTAFSLGMESEGVLSVSKHFPGHGDTNVDSHKALPVLERDREGLDTLELAPFREYFKAQLGGVMVAHMAVPALDNSGTPASLSHAISTGLLKDEMGFKGLAFTDALAMKGAAVESGNNAVEALKAGANVLLNPLNPKKDINAVMEAIENGEISADLVEVCVKKMLAYKYALGLNHYTAPNRENLYEIINSAYAKQLIHDLYQAAITVAKNEGNILPINDLAHKSIALVNIGAENGNLFDKICRSYAKMDVFNASSVSADQVKKICKDYDVTICLVNSKGEAAQQHFARFANAKGLVAVFMMQPYDIYPFASMLTNAQAVMVANASNEACLSGAAMALFAGIPVDGHLPVSIPGVAPAGASYAYAKTRLGFATPQEVGLSPRMTERIDSVVNKALKAGAFTGCQVIVGRNGYIVYDQNFGHTTKGGAPVADNTLFDLASVSKTVGTLPGVMKAYDLGLFNLDEPVSKHIPGMNIAGKDSVTARQLLYHETGIRPALNVYNIMMDTTTFEAPLLTGKPDKKHPIKIYNGLYGAKGAKMRTDIVRKKPEPGFEIEIAKGIYGGKITYDTIMRRIYESPVFEDRKFRYSCLNFSLLMDLEQRVTGQPHNVWVTDSVWAPIGAFGFTYRPAEKYPLSQIAATENDVYLRKQHVHGFVHDELCAFSTGVQGNAGVFGSAIDLAKLCQTWLNGGYYGDARIFSEPTNTLFTTDKSPNSHRGLGFDKPHPNPEMSTTCEEAGPTVFGHTGFTGTVFWVDPSEDLFMVFLSNRVDPTRNNAAFAESAIRPTVMSIVYQSIE